MPASTVFSTDGRGGSWYSGASTKASSSIGSSTSPNGLEPSSPTSRSASVSTSASASVSTSASASVSTSGSRLPRALRALRMSPLDSILPKFNSHHSDTFLSFLAAQVRALESIKRASIMDCLRSMLVNTVRSSLAKNAASSVSCLNSSRSAKRSESIRSVLILPNRRGLVRTDPHPWVSE